MIKTLLGSLQIRLVGARPERALNCFAAAGIRFWDVRRIDAEHFRCKIYPTDAMEAEQAALLALCTLERELERGLPRRLRGLRKRPILVLGTVFAILFSLFAQNFIWVIRVQGNVDLSRRQILHALTEEGIGFGTWAPDIRSQKVRYWIQLRLPEVEWLAANRNGCILNVLVTEREAEPEEGKLIGPANLTASRAGIVTSVSALNGTAAVAPGDAVVAGELLISGITTWENRSQLTQAAGEVFALTDRQMTAVFPTDHQVKRYTGRVTHEITLVLGRNRIKIFGNSRIPGACCDKIIETRILTLPGGDELPVRLEVATLREYTTETEELPLPEAQQRLQGFVLAYCKHAMIAGTILETSFQIIQKDGCYLLYADLSCEEMISVAVPIRILSEEDTLGETDQCGENGADH